MSPTFFGMRMTRKNVWKVVSITLFPRIWQKEEAYDGQIIMLIIHNLFSSNYTSGLIDGHTHPVWVGDRVHEFAMKVNKTYSIIKTYFPVLWYVCVQSFQKNMSPSNLMLQLA